MKQALDHNEMAQCQTTRILVVDDSAAMRTAAEELCRARGYEVVTAKNGEQACEAVCQKGPFGLVLMDCEMPEMDGYEATRVIRKLEKEDENFRALYHAQVLLSKRLPIIALTGNGRRNGREKCLAAGMDDHYTKPLAPMQLEEILSKWYSRLDD